MTATRTTILSPRELAAAVFDALALYSSDIEFLRPGNPFLIRVNKNKHYVFIRNVTSTGKGRPDPDECRIQMSNAKGLSDACSSGHQIAILGFSADHGTFTAWEPAAVDPRVGVKENISLYSKFSVQDAARNQGIAANTDLSGNVSLSFRPDYLGLYLDNIATLPMFKESALRQICGAADGTNTPAGNASTPSFHGRKVIINHTRYSRDSGFRRIVCEAYEHTCAFCGIQLDLVEAAHVVPHCHSTSSDHINNGVCLCALHHTAFDNRLIYIDGKYKIALNDAKMRYLTKIHRRGGFDAFKTGLLGNMRLPEHSSHYPATANIALGNRVRGIN